MTVSSTAQELIAYCRQSRRVCPQPLRWQELWELLPARERVGNGWQPASPLILATWWDTSDLEKMARLAEHLKWAQQNGALASASTYLRNLKEKEWHHLGD